MAGEFKVRTKQVIQLLGMVLAFALFAISSPAIAHKKHKEPAPVENIAGASAAPQTTAAGGVSSRWLTRLGPCLEWNTCWYKFH